MEPGTSNDVTSPAEKAQSSENAGTRSSFAGWLSRLNQPIAVTVVGGVIVFVLTSCMQQQYWIAQQDYLFQQESMKFKLATIDETIKSVDMLLSAEGAEFTAYESHFDPDQTKERDHDLDIARQEWDKEFDLRKLRIQLYFPNKNIQSAWEKVDSDLATLDCYMMRLGSKDVPKGFGCESLQMTNLSEDAVITKGRPNIEQTEGDLQILAKLMEDWASKPHH